MRHPLGPYLVVLTLSVSNTARSVECHPASGISSCVDANALWLAPGSARWLSLSSPETTSPGRVGFALATQRATKPLRLVVPSQADDGREVQVIRAYTEQDLELSIGLTTDLELGLSFPVVSRQTGAGSQGLTAQASAPLDPVAERDPRLSVARRLRLSESVNLKPRLELALPFGNRAAFASFGTTTFAPALPVHLKLGRFASVAEAGLRARAGVDLGSVHFGSQALFALGVSFEILSQQLLTLNAEAFLLPSLSQASSARGERAGIQTTLLPAEYLFSLRSRPQADAPWSVAVAAGGGLALSTEDSAVGTERFMAPTTPALRLLAEVRYAPSD